MEKLALIMEIDLKKQKIYIGEESGAGAEYNYTNVNDLANRIKFYLTNYYGDKINRKEGIR